jgi:hypothetical protein
MRFFNNISDCSTGFLFSVSLFMIFWQRPIRCDRIGEHIRGTYTIRLSEEKKYMVTHTGTNKIETERLLLRRFDHADIDSMLRDFFWRKDHFEGR